MNTTPNPDRDRLDPWLDNALRDLPELEAPESLLPKVMARVARQGQKKRQPWFVALRWSLALISAVCLLWATYFSPPAFAFFSQYPSTLQLGSVMENVNAGIQIFATVGEALGKVFGLISHPALLPILAVMIVFLASFFAGMATLIFQLTFSSGRRPNPNCFSYE